jgi:hypothetical protein
MAAGLNFVLFNAAASPQHHPKKKAPSWLPQAKKLRAQPAPTLTA